MWQELMPGLRIKLFMTLLLGIIYPLVVTGISQVIFPHQANGSLIRSKGEVIGSELIGQNFARPEYFHPRPSAAGKDGYDATASGGSNLGPANPALTDRVKQSVAAFRKENPDFAGPIPADLLTTSASGLDPHISPASADAQVSRIAKARGITPEQVKAVVQEFTERPDLGVFGESRVNVLRINLALDSRFPKRG